ncbi:MAG: DSD1 family PLP-dependent enzyme, partial [Pseudomonadota bacterium]
EEIALSVMATVIGHSKSKNRFIIDAGWMAMSRDRGTAGQRIDQGYGLVCDLDGRPAEDLIVTGANQEHGLVTSRSGEPLDFGLYPLGTQLRVLPNHACSTAAQYDNYHVIESGSIIDTWSRVREWK